MGVNMGRDGMGRAALPPPQCLCLHGLEGLNLALGKADGRMSGESCLFISVIKSRVFLKGRVNDSLHAIYYLIEKLAVRGGKNGCTYNINEINFACIDKS